MAVRTALIAAGLDCLSLNRIASRFIFCSVLAEEAMVHGLPLLILFCFVQTLSAPSILPNEAVCNDKLQVGSIRS